MLLKEVQEIIKAIKKNGYESKNLFKFKPSQKMVVAQSSKKPPKQDI